VKNQRLRQVVHGMRMILRNVHNAQFALKSLRVDFVKQVLVSVTKQLHVRKAHLVKVVQLVLASVLAATQDLVVLQRRQLQIDHLTVRFAETDSF
jgi:hypothetical protein